MTITSKSDRDRIRQKARQKQVQRERDKTNRDMANAKREAGIRYLGRGSKEADAEWMRQMEIMPCDTRSLTGRLMGDPVPGDPRRPWIDAALREEGR